MIQTTIQIMDSSASAISIVGRFSPKQVVIAINGGNCSWPVRRLKIVSDYGNDGTAFIIAYSCQLALSFNIMADVDNFSI